MKSPLTYILLVAVSFSCDLATDLELDLPAEKPRLVANCFFGADSTWTAMVYSSKPTLQHQPDNGPFLKNASVTISDGDNDVQFELDSSYYMVYRALTGRARVGKAYVMNVSAPGFETITASVIVPEPVQIIDASSYRVATGESGTDFERTIVINFQDPPAEKNYYAVKILGKDGQFERFNRPFYLSSADETLDDKFVHATIYHFKSIQTEYLFFDDQFLGGESVSTVQLRFNESVINDPTPGKSTYQITLLTVSEAYYKYRLTLEKQKDQMKDPFAQPVQVHGNFGNGFGILGAYSESQIVLETE